MSTSVGYNDYIGGISLVHQGDIMNTLEMFRTSEEYHMIAVADTMNTCRVFSKSEGMW